MMAILRRWRKRQMGKSSRSRSKSISLTYVWRAVAREEAAVRARLKIHVILTSLAESHPARSFLGSDLRVK
jgi:hypothetical protein